MTTFIIFAPKKQFSVIRFGKLSQEHHDCCRMKWLVMAGLNPFAKSELRVAYFIDFFVENQKNTRGKQPPAAVSSSVGQLAVTTSSAGAAASDTLADSLFFQIVKRIEKYVFKDTIDYF
jgi:hypothetical protein